MEIRVKRAICCNTQCNGLLQYDDLSNTWYHIYAEAFKICGMVGGKPVSIHYETIKIPNDNFDENSSINRRSRSRR